jgi:hypothetical protein
VIIVAKKQASYYKVLNSEEVYVAAKGNTSIRRHNKVSSTKEGVLKVKVSYESGLQQAIKSFNRN